MLSYVIIEKELVSKDFLILVLKVWLRFIVIKLLPIDLFHSVHL